MRRIKAYKKPRRWRSSSRRGLDGCTWKERRWRPPRTESELEFEKLLKKHGIQYVVNRPRFVKGRRLPYWPDFYIPKIKWVIEIDGARHRGPSARAKDLLREQALKKTGVRRIVRFWNSEVQDAESTVRFQDMLFALNPQKMKRLVDFCFVEAERSNQA